MTSYATGSARTNIEGQNLVLESATGTIGGTGGVDPITIDLVSGGTLTARAQGDVSVYAVNGSLMSYLSSNTSNELRFQLSREDRPRPYSGPRSAALGPIT